MIDFIYAATVCGPIDIEQAIQSITEEVVDNSVSCSGTSVDCISYDAQVVIFSFINGSKSFVNTFH